MRRLLTGLLLALACAPAAACASSAPPPGPVTVTLLSHGGTTEEQAALRTIVAGFHAAHPDVTVAVSIAPEGDYTAHLQAAVAADTLPDVIDVDGPLVSSFAAQGAFTPLEKLLPASTVSGMLPTLRTQGTWDGHLWALGTFESGLGIWADRADLVAAGIRIPTGPRDAWTAAEFTAALAALAARSPTHVALDVREDYGVGEWLTYGFYPLISSAGGSLAQLDSPATLQALTALHSWAPYVDPDKDGAAFTSGRVALSWVGHWTYPDYAKALGSQLILLPLPDLGHGSRTASGSWAWAVAHDTPHQKEAAELLAWLDSDSSIATMTAANGAVPGTTSALAASTLLAAGGPLHLYAEQFADGDAVPRPRTDSYPTLTAAYANAVHGVLTGVAPAAALKTAVAQLAP